MLKNLNTSGDDVQRAIFARAEFTTMGNLSGRYGMPDSGRLPRNIAALLRERVLDHVHPDGVALTTEERWARERDVYTVYSFGTPIAVHVPSTGWILIGCQFSITTSKHQLTVRVALHGVPKIHVGDFRRDLTANQRALMSALIDSATFTAAHAAHPATVRALTRKGLLTVDGDGMLQATPAAYAETYAPADLGGDITPSWQSQKWGVTQ